MLHPKPVTVKKPPKPLRSRQRKEWEAERQSRPRAVAVPLTRPVNMARIEVEVRAQPKTVEHRNPDLLAMARGRRCLLAIPGVCTGDRSTTVACHSNLSIHGKGGARKADDEYSVWGCTMGCHHWLDSGPAPADEKTAAFMRAHLDQVTEWRRIVGDLSETPRARRAAHWALLQLDATPIGEPS